MNDALEQKVTAVLTFFYKDLFQEIYFDEITKTINEHEVLPLADDDLLENIALVWCISYYLLPIIKGFESSDEFEKFAQVVSSFTGIDKQLIVIQSQKA